MERFLRAGLIADGWFASLLLLPWQAAVVTTVVGAFLGGYWLGGKQREA